MQVVDQFLKKKKPSQMSVSKLSGQYMDEQLKAKHKHLVIYMWI